MLGTAGLQDPLFRYSAMGTSSIVMTMSSWRYRCFPDTSTILVCMLCHVHFLPPLIPLPDTSSLKAIPNMTIICFIPAFMRISIDFQTTFLASCDHLLNPHPHHPPAHHQSQPANSNNERNQLPNTRPQLTQSTDSIPTQRQLELQDNDDVDEQIEYDIVAKLSSALQDW